MSRHSNQLSRAFPWTLAPGLLVPSGNRTEVWNARGGVCEGLFRLVSGVLELHAEGFGRKAMPDAHSTLTPPSFSFLKCAAWTQGLDFWSFF